MFNKVMVLAKGGRVIFCDQPFSLKDFLYIHSIPCPAGHNPADFVAEIASGD
jgi:hypothetical protein